MEFCGSWCAVPRNLSLAGSGTRAAVVSFLFLLGGEGVVFKLCVLCALQCGVSGSACLHKRTKRKHCKLFKCSLW